MLISSAPAQKRQARHVLPKMCLLPHGLPCSGHLFNTTYIRTFLAQVGLVGRQASCSWTSSLPSLWWVEGSGHWSGAVSSTYYSILRTIYPLLFTLYFLLCTLKSKSLYTFEGTPALANGVDQGLSKRGGVNDKGVAHFNGDPLGET